MAYFNGYPATYQQVYPAYTQFAPVQQQNAPVQSSVQATVQGGRIWVQGEAGAKSYLVAPNSTVDLWDSENQIIYQKSADASGMPSIKVIDYTVREQNRNPSNQLSGNGYDNSPMYATKDEIKAVSDEISALRKKVDRMFKKQEVIEDE